LGLDVYVGPLTRYHGGDWETPVQRWASGQGIGYSVVTPSGETATRVENLGRIREVVLAWRDVLSRSLGRPLDWNEDVSAPSYSERVSFEPYAFLKVLAASIDRGEPYPGDAEVPEVSEDHPVFRAATGDDSPRYPHLYFPELWLPCDFASTFVATDLTGQRGPIGSSVRLLAELRDVEGRIDAAAPDGSDDGARYGLAVFLKLAERSVAQRLPMRLDY
jgi:hypothetical protein